MSSSPNKETISKHKKGSDTRIIANGNTIVPSSKSPVKKILIPLVYWLKLNTGNQKKELKINLHSIILQGFSVLSTNRRWVSNL